MGLASGARLGQYEIVAPLGSGGMGEVYRARDPRLGREVALKVLPPAVREDAERLRRFEQEARAAGALNHPNVLAVYDVGEHEGAPYLVTELLEGATVRERLAAGRVPPRKALEWAAQVARGLGAAHAKGIVHRDLKPENLFVTKDGRVKILDFGLAKALGGEVSATESTLAETEPGAVLGTAGYMAPEQVRGKPADARADIFAFGAVLYELLAGKRAFDGDSAVERGHAILTKDPPPLAASGVTVPAAVERVIQRCLEKATDDRFQSARDLGFALEAFSDTAVSGTRAEPARAPLRRAARVAGLAALLMVFGVGCVLLGRWQGRRPRAGAPASQPVAAPASQPSFKRITFRHGSINGARFAEGGRTVAFTGKFEGEPQYIHVATPGNSNLRTIGPPWASLRALSPQGDVVFGVFSQRDPGSLTLARMSLAGGAPREVLENVGGADFGPGGELLVSRRVNGRLRLEFPPGKVLYEEAIGAGIRDVRLSPQGDAVAFYRHPVAGDTRGTVEMVGLDGKRRTLAGPFGSVGDGLAWSPDGREVWCNADGIRAVTREGRQRVVSTTPMLLSDIAPDGRVLLASHKRRFRMSGLVPGNEREVGLSWLDGSRVVTLSADGRTVLFTELMEGAAPEQVYLRRTGSEPPVNLCRGGGSDLSADGKWALVSPEPPWNTLSLVPTGAGESRALPRGTVEELSQASFVGDGKRIVIWGREAGGRSKRIFLQDVAGGPPRPLPAEGLEGMSRPSADGRLVAAKIKGAWFLLPLDGGTPRPLGIPPRDNPDSFTVGGRGLFVFADLGLPPAGMIRVYRYDLATAKKTPWRDVVPPEPGGLPMILEITPDGRWYVQTYWTEETDLYVAEGLR
jgi:eukaryotic-like serine/threonine-protein kinase